MVGLVVLAISGATTGDVFSLCCCRSLLIVLIQIAQEENNLVVGATSAAPDAPNYSLANDRNSLDYVLWRESDR